MGLFDRLRGGGGKGGEMPVLDDPVARAVLTPAISTMVGDGEINDAETAQINNLIAFSPIFQEHGPAAISAFIQTILAAIQKNGHEATIKEAAGELTMPLRETAMCFALRMALADGKIEDGEKASLSQTGHYMEIPPETFGKMLEILAMLQRPRDIQQVM
ncbi:MAG: tellurite resistance TerB family protein [Pseudomonadota bacterium]